MKMLPSQLGLFTGAGHQSQTRVLHPIHDGLIDSSLFFCVHSASLCVELLFLQVRIWLDFFFQLDLNLVIKALFSSKYI